MNALDATTVCITGRSKCRCTEHWELSAGMVVPLGYSRVTPSLEQGAWPKYMAPLDFQMFDT